MWGEQAIIIAFTFQHAVNCFNIPTMTSYTVHISIKIKRTHQLNRLAQQHSQTHSPYTLHTNPNPH